MMDNDVSEEMIRTTLLAKTSLSEKRVCEIGVRLRHVTEMLGKLNAPPCDGQFILVIKDNEPQFWHFLQKEQNVVGRADSCDIELADSAASREHCKIQQCGTDWELVDNGSRNGLAVNGLKMKHRILCDGDLVSIGGYELIYVVNETLEF